MSRAAWMLTASGHEYHLTGMTTLHNNAPVLEDIAHHLAQINRFNGACSRPYSVAEHSLLVERIGAERGASPGLRLALLMHDAHEAYVGDVTSPAKVALGLEWMGFEAAHQLNTRRHFGLLTGYAGWRKEVRHCDLVALATERRDLLPWDAARHAPWPIIDTPGDEVQPWPDQLDPHESALPWRGWRDLFLQRFHALRALVHAGQQQVATA